MTESPGLKRRNQSSINNYFVVCDDGRKKCMNCDAKYSKNSGNSTLRSHLESKHKIKLILTQEDENVIYENLWWKFMRLLCFIKIKYFK